MNPKETICRFLVAAVLFAILIVAACGQPTSPPQETPTAQAMPTATATSEPTSTAVPTAVSTATLQPTATPKPTATSTATPVPTPTPNIQILSRRDYSLTYNGLSLQACLGVDSGLYNRDQGQVKTIYLKSNGESQLAQAIVLAEYNAYKRDGGVASLAAWIEEVQAAVGQQQRTAISFKVVGFTEASALPQELIISPYNPVCFVWSNEVGYIKGRKSEPEQNIQGSGVSFILMNDGTVIIRQTLPHQLVKDRKDPVPSLAASLAMATALSRMSLPLERQRSGKEIADAPNEQIDKLLRGEDLHTPLFIVGEP